ncbi:MAG: hypothetical protein RLZZ53_3192 [Acidobacteriota bacterium]
MRVTPRASRTQVAGVRDGVLQIKLAAAPVDGAANDQLIALLAATLKIPKRDVTIVSGERSRSKRVRINGMERDQILSKLVV